MSSVNTDKSSAIACYCTCRWALWSSLAQARGGELQHDKSFLHPPHSLTLQAHPKLLPAALQVCNHPLTTANTPISSLLVIIHNAVMENNHALNPLMIFFLPTSWKVLSTFWTFFPDGVQVAQTVVHFSHFQVQARKGGVLGWVLGCLCTYISDVWRWSKEQGLGVVFWAKLDPIWAKGDPSGPKCSRIGKNKIQ